MPFEAERFFEVTGDNEMKTIIMAAVAVSTLGLSGAALAAAPSTTAPATAHVLLSSEFAPATTYEQASDYRGRKYRRGYREGYRDARQGNDYYDGPVWRGNDGRYRCRRDNGTTGLIIGGAAGALIGNEVAGRGDKLLGTIIGAAGGALLGREVDKSRGFKCR
jgi:Glycine zipper 2TM domain